ncbi:MAG: TetR/AcrR family transcriptional regulator [Canibacter sp.]
MAHEVPGFFQRLWRLPAPPQHRGRKSTLDIDTVVNTAIQLADRDGLEAATLPKVAKALHVTAMSLYRHIGSKHELLQLMMDAASEPENPGAPASHWREGLEQWALDLWELYRERPWLPRVPIFNMPSGPNQIAWLERGFAQLTSTELDWNEKLTALTLLSGFVRHTALLADELKEGRDDHQAQAESEREYGEALHLVVSPEQFPQTSAMLASEALGSESDLDNDSDRDFTNGLALILDGLGTRVSAAPRKHSP